jgi:dolichol-phosphate mannosyltransferase
MTAAVYIIIPVYNEALNIGILGQHMQQVVAEFSDLYSLHFVLIDDGSSDGTSECIRQSFSGLSYELIRFDQNQGPGVAFATAFERLETSLRDEDWVVTMEGDNTSRHTLIRQMFMRMQEGYDAVLASPYLYGGRIVKTSPFRLCLSFFANTFFKELLGLRGIMTMSSFFRLYRGRTIKQLQYVYGPKIVESKGFESMVELLMKMVFLNMTISEVPLVLDTSLRQGKSKMKILKTMVRMLSLYFKKDQWLKHAQQRIIYAYASSSTTSPSTL